MTGKLAVAGRSARQVHCLLPAPEKGDPLTWTTGAAVAAVALMVPALAALAWNIAGRRGAKAIAPRGPLTPTQQKMYFRLCEAAPELIVLAQVSFTALLGAPSRLARRRFDRMVADFAICDKSFNVIAVVELDDASAGKNRKEDADRDAILQAAGYEVLRWREVPDLGYARRGIASVLARRKAP